MRLYRRVPSHRLIRRYELTKYNKNLPLEIKSLETGRVRIPTQQHLGSPAKPIVKEGNRVKEGQLIGDIPGKELGAKTHASISGRVTYVGPDAVVIEG